MLHKMMSVKEIADKEVTVYEYKLFLPNLLDENLGYPFTLLVPVLSTEICGLNDKWIVDVLSSETNKTIKELIKPISSSLTIQLKLFEASFKFLGRASLSVCTCKEKTDDLLYNVQSFRLASSGSIVTHLDVNLEMLQEHSLCYGKYVCINVQIAIPKIEVEMITSAQSEVSKLSKGTILVNEQKADTIMVGMTFKKNETFISNYFNLDMNLWSSKSLFFHIIYCKMIIEGKVLKFYQINGIDPTDFNKLFQFERDDEIEIKSLTEATLLIKTASLLQLKKSKEYIEQEMIYFLDNCKDDNIIKSIRKSQVFNLRKLKTHLEDFGKQIKPLLLKNSEMKLRIVSYLYERWEFARIVLKICNLDEKTDVFYL